MHRLHMTDDISFTNSHTEYLASQYYFRIPIRSFTHTCTLTEELTHSYPSIGSQNWRRIDTEWDYYVRFSYVRLAINERGLFLFWCDDPVSLRVSKPCIFVYDSVYPARTHGSVSGRLLQSHHVSSLDVFWIYLFFMLYISLLCNAIISEIGLQWCQVYTCLHLAICKCSVAWGNILQ